MAETGGMIFNQLKRGKGKIQNINKVHKWVNQNHKHGLAMVHAG